MFETGAAFFFGYAGSLGGDDSGLVHRHGIQLGVRNGFLRNHVSVHTAVIHGFANRMTVPGVRVQNQIGFALL